MNLNQIKKLPSRTDWKRVNAMRDKDIDYSDTPDMAALVSRGMARPVGRPKKEMIKQQITIRFDTPVVSALRKTGPGWQTRVSEYITEGVRRGVFSAATA